MPVRESEAFILCTYPYRETDLIVSFVSRDQGKLRGIARRARRPKSPFGSGLERLAHVRLSYFQRDNRDLVRLDRAELLDPPLFLRADYVTAVALDYISEVCDRLLPEREPNDAFFRLVALVLGKIRSTLDEIVNSQNDLRAPVQRNNVNSLTSEKPRRGMTSNAQSCGAGLWTSLTYFSLWAVRLGGWLPPIDTCIQSGTKLPESETAYFDRSQPGLFSSDFRGPNAWTISPASRKIATQMLRTSLGEIQTNDWNATTAADLRRFLNQRLEEHSEAKLKTASLLEQLAQS